MLKKRQIILLGISVLLVSGCCNYNRDRSEPESEIEESGNDSGFPMQFNVAIDETRTSTPAENHFNSFALVGWKDSSYGREYVFGRDSGGNDPYIADFDGSNWVYVGKSYSGGVQFMKYWDLSAESYTFSAYAPASGAPDGQAASFANGAISITGLTANLPENETFHWFESLYQRLKTPSDLDLLSTTPTPIAISAMTDVVSLKFHHLLSKMVFKIYNTEGSELRVNSFTVTLADEAKLYTKGDYTYPNTFNYDNNTRIGEICDETFSTLKMGNSLNNATTLYSVSVIPQNLVGIKANVILDYGDHNTISTTIDLGTPQNSYQWSKDRIYIYILALSLSNDIIMVNLETMPWVLTDEIEEEQSNW